MVQKKPKKSLIILTCNEIDGLKAIFKKIPLNSADEVFAVDWNSIDGTIEFFKSHKIPVIKQTIKGRGRAFIIGMEKAKGNHLLFYSPDGNEDPNDIPKLFKLLDEGFDMSIGSRFMKGSRNDEDNQSLKPRKWVNQAFSLLVRFFWGGGITDSINGFRAIKKDSMQRLKLDAWSFYIEFQMTIRALKLNMKIAEIPSIEGDRIGGVSKLISMPEGFRYLKSLIREILIGEDF